MCTVARHRHRLTVVKMHRNRTDSVKLSSGSIKLPTDDCSAAATSQIIAAETLQSEIYKVAISELLVCACGENLTLSSWFASAQL